MDSFKNLVKAMGLFLTKMQTPLMYTLGSVHGVPAPAQGCALLLRSPVPELRPKALRGCLTCISPRAGVLGLTVRENPEAGGPGLAPGLAWTLPQGSMFTINPKSGGHCSSPSS